MIWTRYLLRAGAAPEHEAGAQTRCRDVWIGFELPFDRDFSHEGLLRACDLPLDELRRIGVTRWNRLSVPEPDEGDEEILSMLLDAAGRELANR